MPKAPIMPHIQLRNISQIRPMYCWLVIKMFKLFCLSQVHVYRKQEAQLVTVSY